MSQLATVTPVVRAPRVVRTVRRHLPFYSSCRDSQITLDDAMPPELPLLLDSEDFEELPMEDGHWQDSLGDGAKYSRPGAGVYETCYNLLDSEDLSYAC